MEKPPIKGHFKGGQTSQQRTKGWVPSMLTAVQRSHVLYIYSYKCLLYPQGHASLENGEVRGMGEGN